MSGLRSFNSICKHRTAAYIEKLATLPRRGGKIDMEALGKTIGELAHQWSGELGASVEDLLEAFLESRIPKG
jgi:hypothetical protein